MVDQNSSATRPSRVLLGWVFAYVVAGIASTLVPVLTGHVDTPVRDIPTWAMALSIVVMWVVMLAILQRQIAETPRLSMSALQQWLQPSDIFIGLPLGIVTQVVIVNAINWPLNKIWPDIFNPDDVTQRANDLVDNATGVWIVVLALVVVVGAPLVEEIVYRGALQPTLVTVWGAPMGIGVVAVLFAAIHQSVVEFPGLLAVAVVFGLARHFTGRLGLSIVTHMAFNATALLLVILK